MDKFIFIADQMAAIDVPYELMEWTATVKYPYFVGEFTEVPVTTGDGLEESTLLLTGFHRGSYLDLEKIKEKIKHHFHPRHGRHGSTKHGQIVAFYDGSLYLPTGEAGLKKIQINITIKEWRND